MIDTETEADGPKRYRAGTHRVVDPEGTLTRVMPFVAAMGVTRVAMLTGLDIVGIPVAAATRPNSRSIAVHQGKGLSVAAAKASAVMEAVEMFHADTWLPLRLESYAELSSDVSVADPALLPRCRAAVEADRLLWVEAQDLMSGAPLWVPYEMVSADFTLPYPSGSGVFQATTNGLASGNHRLEAILHGLCEVVERDAIALWRAAVRTQEECALNPGSVDGPTSRALLDLFERAGIVLRIWDVTSDIRLPVFVCLAVAPDPTEGVEPELGSGCHADRDIALARALTEAARARLTRISGARDDFPVESYDSPVRLARQESARRLLGQSPARRDFRAAPTWEGPTLRHDLDAALSRLSDAGLRHVAWVDLTRPEFCIPVGRIVVPGLEGPWTPECGDYLPGRRACAVSERI